MFYCGTIYKECFTVDKERIENGRQKEIEISHKGKVYKYLRDDLQKIKHEYDSNLKKWVYRFPVKEGVKK